MSRNRQSNFLSRLQSLYGIILFGCHFFLTFFHLFISKIFSKRTIKNKYKKDREKLIRMNQKANLKGGAYEHKQKDNLKAGLISGRQSSSQLFCLPNSKIACCVGSVLKTEDEGGAWEAHHKVAVASGGQDVLSNCKVLCLDCHKKTYTYGRH